MEAVFVGWFGHVQRRDANNVTRRVMELAIPSTRRRGRPKKTWQQQVKEDMAGMGVTQDEALDRKEWREKGRTIPTPSRLGKGLQGEHSRSNVCILHTPAWIPADMISAFTTNQYNTRDWVHIDIIYVLLHT